MGTEKLDLFVRRHDCSSHQVRQRSESQCVVQVPIDRSHVEGKWT